MADLGTLSFSVVVKNETERQLDKIRKDILNKLNVMIEPEIKVDIASQIRQQLKGAYDIKLQVDKSSIEQIRQQTQELINSVSVSGKKFSASDLRATRASVLIEEHEQRLASLREQTRQKTANANAAEERLNAARARTALMNERLKVTQQQLNRLMDESAQKGINLHGVFMKLGGTVALGMLAKQIVKVTGEFEFMGQAIKSLVGSEREGVELMEKLKDFARISPLEVRDVTKAAQTLLGFNVELAKVPDMIQRLGDVSMGNKDRFNALTLAFAQTTSAARLTGEDLRQYVNAGFNPLQVIAERTGKSMRELKDEMSKGAISVEMVEQAFIDATSAGGKFYKMSERQSETINGQLAKLRDSLDRAFDAIGRNNRGVIMGAISSASALIANYEKVMHILEGLVTTYGLYRTAVFLATEAEKGYTIAQTLSMQATILMEKAQKALNTTMLANPYVLAAVALGGLVTIMLASVDTTNEAEIANERYNETVRKNSEEVENEKKHIDDLLNTLSDENEAQGKRTAAYNELLQKYPEIFSKYKTEKDLIDNLTEARQRENAEIEKKARLLSKQQFDDASNRKKELNRLKWLQENIDLNRHGNKPTAEQAEYIRLYRKYEKEIKEAQTWYGSVGTAISKLSGVADKEYNINVGERRKQQLTDITNAIKNLTPDQAKAQAKRYNDLIRQANESGKKWIGFGGDSVPISLDDAKKVAKQLEEQANTETHTLKEWAEQTAKNTDNARKAAKAIFDDTKQYTKEQAQKIIKDANSTLAASEKESKSFTIDDKTGAKEEKALEKQRKDAEREAVQLAEAQEKIIGIRTKAQLAAEKAVKDLEFLTREAEITLTEDATERAIKQIELDKDKKLEAITREYEELRQKRIEEAKKLWDADPKNKGNNFYLSDSFLNAASDDRYTEAEKANKAAREKAVNYESIKALEKVNAEKMRLMYEYLREYGTVQMRRYAIEKEYNDKILKATDENQKAILEKQKQAALAEVNAQEIALGIDWGTAFSGIGNVLKDVAIETLIEVEKYMQTAEFKALSAESKKTYTDLAAKLRKEGSATSVSPFNFKIWGQIDEQVKAYQKSVKELRDAQHQHNLAVEELKKAEKDLAEATDDASREIAKKAVETAKGKVTATGAKQIQAQQQKDSDQQQLTDSTNRATQGLQNFASYLDEMNNGTLYGFANGISKLITSLFKGSNGIGKALGELGGKIGGLVGAILQILDALGDDPTKFIDDLFEKIIGAVDGILNQIQTGELVRTLVEDIVNLIATLFTNSWEAAYNSFTNPFAFWGEGDYDRLWAGNGDKMEKEIDELSKSNEKLAKAIDSLSERISDKDSTNAESEEAFKNALAAEKEWRENQKKAIDLRASEWTNTGYGFLKLGGKSSFNQNAPGQTWEGWEQFNRILKKYGYSSLVNSTESLWNLTPEEMKLLRDFAPSAWSELFNTDGHKNPEELVEEYIEHSGAIDELAEALNEKLTGYDWSAFRDSYKDLLADLDSTNEDFADNLEKLLTNAILNSLINETYKDRIKRLYQMIADAASDESEGGSTMTERELAEIRAANESLSNDLIQARQNLIDAGVLKESSSGSSSSMGSSIKGVSEQTAGLLGSYMNGIRADVSVNRAFLALHLPNIENILTRQSVIAEIQVTHLANIANNTKRTADNTEAISALVVEQGRIYDILHRIDTGVTRVAVK